MLKLCIGCKTASSACYWGSRQLSSGWLIVLIMYLAGCACAASTPASLFTTVRLREQLNCPPFQCSIAATAGMTQQINVFIDSEVEAQIRLGTFASHLLWAQCFESLQFIQEEERAWDESICEWSSFDERRRACICHTHLWHLPVSTMTSTRYNCLLMWKIGSWVPSWVNLIT